MLTIKHKLVSSLVKVFPDTEPKNAPEDLVFTALKNETISFQLAFQCSGEKGIHQLSPVIVSPIADWTRARKVVLAPATYPCHPVTDDNYERTAPGLFPDILRDYPTNKALTIHEQWQSFWIDVKVPAHAKAGVYPIAITIVDDEGVAYGTAKTEVTIYDAILPAQTLIHTQWFHGDCLANYYGEDVFSERHWEIMEHFVATAVERGCNMLLTPLFTPPLDTEKGGERTTIQLIDVTKQNGKYSFGFEKLERWVEMCRRCGMEYLEMSHLFTQWGATAAPKVMATVDGAYQQIFGWDSPAVGGEYTPFLREFLTLLTTKLNALGIEKNTYFHISDEPRLENYESYAAAADSVADLLEDFVIIDALSDFEFYKTGAVQRPIPANNHIEPFLEDKVPHLWTYYCTSQSVGVSNRFMSMPSVRNRIYGAQLYKFSIEGILHWGYNFYNTGHSLYPIDPYQVTDAGGIFPAGDPFLVYPQADGRAEESIRMMVQYQAITDQRALCYLEELAGKEFVLQLLEGELATPITFSVYPTSDTYLLQLRNRVNAEIAKRV